MVDHARSSGKASRVGIGYEARGGGDAILIECGVVGIQGIFLGVVELHGIALYRRSAAWKWVIH